MQVILHSNIDNVNNITRNNIVIFFVFLSRLLNTSVI